MKRTIAGVLGALGLAALVATSLPAADAKITEKRTNPAGQETRGKGKAITVTNVNPAGKAPAGQNK